MRYIVLAIAAFSTMILAQQAAGPNPFKVPQGFALTAGKPTNIEWNPTTGGTVTLRLREGANSNLTPGTVIGSNLPNNGAFTYTPPADTVRNSDYAIEIVSDSDPAQVNYTPQFVIESSNTVASISSSSSASTTASSTGTSSTSASSTTSASSSSSSTTSGSSSMSTMTSSTTTGSSSSTGSTSMTSSMSASAVTSPTGSSSASATTASATSAPKSGAPGRITSSGVAVMAGLLLAAVAW